MCPSNGQLHRRVGNDDGCECPITQATGFFANRSTKLVAQAKAIDNYVKKRSLS